LEPDKIKEQLRTEQFEKIKLAFEVQKKQAEYQFELAKQQIVFQARLQKYQQVVNRIFGIQTVDPATGLQLDENGNPMLPQEENTMMPGEELPLQGGDPAAEEEQAAPAQQNPNDIAAIQEQIQTLQQLPPEQQEYYLSQMDPQARQMIEEVMRTQGDQMDTGDTDMRQMPEQRPPRRKTLG
jgi:hypothetical protein